MYEKFAGHIVESKVKFFCINTVGTSCVGSAPIALTLQGRRLKATLEFCNPSFSFPVILFAFIQLFACNYLTIGSSLKHVLLLWMFIDVYIQDIQAKK